MASDLATFTNAEGGIERTSRAITSALTGEYEALKSLGIVLSEETLKYELARQRAEGLRFESEREAKAMARLTAIRRQMADATGQTLREGGNFSSQLETFRAKLKDLKAAFGVGLLEPATAALSKLSALADRLTATSEETRKNVAVFSVLGATAVPLGVALAGVAGAVKTYLNISRLAEVATTAQTTAAVANVAASQAETTATKLNVVAIEAERNADALEAQATKAAAKYSALLTEQKRLETAATIANTKAILAERRAKKTADKADAARGLVLGGAQKALDAQASQAADLASRARKDAAAAAANVAAGQARIDAAASAWNAASDAASAARRRNGGVAKLGGTVATSGRWIGVAK